MASSLWLARSRTAHTSVESASFNVNKDVAMAGCVDELVRRSARWCTHEMPLEASELPADLRDAAAGFRRDLDGRQHAPGAIHDREHDAGDRDRAADAQHRDADLALELGAVALCRERAVLRRGQALLAAERALRREVGLELVHLVLAEEPRADAA